MKYNYAIIGCGAAGRVHAYHFSQEPIIECVAVADPNIENAQFFQDHFGFKSYYYDYKDMLAKEKFRTSIKMSRVNSINWSRIIFQIVYYFVEIV